MTMDTTDRVSEAFAAHPREGFLRRADRRRAAHDGPLAIGRGQTNSQPRTVADMLRLLDVLPGHRVLDVGSGSGWTTALLAHLVGPTGSVLGLELEEDLVSFGRDNLDATQQPWARIEQATPGEYGAAAEAPYDRILVSAAATELPGSLVDQLAADGAMVIPVAGVMLRVSNPGPTITEHGFYRFVPLR